jgi:hypothetical protein
MHIATRKETTGHNEGEVATDHHKLIVTYINKVNKTRALNVSPNNFRILVPHLTAPPTLITLRTKTCICLQRSTTIFDTAGEEVILVKRINCQETLFFPNSGFVFFV